MQIKIMLENIFDNVDFMIVTLVNVVCLPKYRKKNAYIKLEKSLFFRRIGKIKIVVSDRCKYFFGYIEEMLFFKCFFL
jgi:hypothetical protein